MLNNQRGLTLIELLAAITITSIVIGAVTMLIHYTTTGTQETATRESTLMESRFLLNTIIDEVKSNLVIASSDEEFALKLDVYEYGLVNNLRKYRLTGDRIYFRFDELTHTVTMEKVMNSVNSIYALTTHISDFTVNLTTIGPTTSEHKTKIEPTLTVQLPKNKEHRSSTIVYVSNPDSSNLVNNFD